MSEYRAVIFDLYNTIAAIDPYKYRDAKRRMADILKVPFDVFMELWRQYSRSCNRGEILTSEERAAKVMRDLGLPIDRLVTRELADIEYELQEKMVYVLPGAVELISQIKPAFRLGLLSNTGMATIAGIQGLGIVPLFDVVLCSYEAHSLKPGWQIYQTLCERLEVPARECIYVGDGDDLELAGAFSLGMYTVWLNAQAERITHTRSGSSYHREATNFSDLLALIRGLQPAES